MGYKYKVMLKREITEFSEEFEIEVPEIKYETIRDEAIKHAEAIDWEPYETMTALEQFDKVKEEKVNE